MPTLVDLQYTAVELRLAEDSTAWCRPSTVLNEPDKALEIFRDTHRLTVASLFYDVPADDPQYHEKFAACCKMAKALRIVPLIVPAAELGTPFNEEIERLRGLVKTASLEGCLVGLKTTIGCMTEDPDTAVVLCDTVKGLALALDPSHYIAGPRQGRDFSKVLPHVCHVYLRDSTKSKLYVRVGQGEVDYGKLISQLQAVGYNRALTVDMTPLEGFEHKAEMRKMRLLLDSLL
ncbi:MAG: xylose isomerase [Planctomycetaceae bacterium]|nr:xylose isomerase [Planctomycetaceae bacterium]